MARVGKYEQKDGVNADFQFLNLGYWTTSRSRYLQIRIHAIPPGKCTLEEVTSYMYLPHCFLCYFSRPYLLHQCKCIYGAHHVFLYYQHYSSKLFLKEEELKSGQMTSPPIGIPHLLILGRGEDREPGNIAIWEILKSGKGIDSPKLNGFTKLGRKHLK